MPEDFVDTEPLPRRRGPGWLSFLVLCSLGIGLVWLKTGSLQTALIGNGLVLPLVFMVIYFSTRSGPASSLERRIARTWLFVRRCICFTVALVCGGLAVLAMVAAYRTHRLELLTVSAFVGVLGALAAWIGAYGAGNRRGFADDRPLHEERKARYGWK
jgi:hypothetical protein